MEIIKEQKSAKYSHNRPEFTQMIQDIKNSTFAEKDAITRTWLLNLRIGDKKEVFYLCKAELKDLVKFGNVISGGSVRTCKD